MDPGHGAPIEIARIAARSRRRGAGHPISRSATSRWAHGCAFNSRRVCEGRCGRKRRTSGAQRTSWLRQVDDVGCIGRANAPRERRRGPWRRRGLWGDAAVVALGQHRAAARHIGCLQREPPRGRGDRHRAGIARARYARDTKRRGGGCGTGTHPAVPERDRHAGGGTYTRAGGSAVRRCALDRPGHPDAAFPGCRRVGRIWRPVRRGRAIGRGWQCGRRRTDWQHETRDHDVGASSRFR